METPKCPGCGKHMQPVWWAFGSPRKRNYGARHRCSECGWESPICKDGTLTGAIQKSAEAVNRRPVVFSQVEPVPEKEPRYFMDEYGTRCREWKHKPTLEEEAEPWKEE